MAHVMPDRNGLGAVNDGDPRSDARTMSYFAEGWRRVAVSVGGNGHVLGLSHTSGRTVVELDDFGGPIAVSRQAIALLTNVEQRWPVVDGDLAGQIRSLARESLPLRYWLLIRLETEGDPPDEIFEILPWELLDQAIASVTGGLKPGGQPGDLVEIRHWLTPAVRGLSSAIEQLDHGLRVGDPRIARLGATALVGNLRDLPMSRIPQSSKDGLANIVTQLGNLDPLYRHAARFVAARLSGAGSVSPLRIDMNPLLEMAGSQGEVREHIENLGDEHHQIRLIQTRNGWVQITAKITIGRTDTHPLAAQPAVFLPLQVRPRDGSPPLGLWLALHVDGDDLVGSLNLALPKGWSQIDADEVPVGVDSLANVSPETLLPSLHAATAMTAERWLEIADELPATHPVRIAATTFENAS